MSTNLNQTEWDVHIDNLSQSALAAGWVKLYSLRELSCYVVEFNTGEFYVRKPIQGDFQLQGRSFVAGPFTDKARAQDVALLLSKMGI